VNLEGTGLSRCGVLFTGLYRWETAMNGEAGSESVEKIFHPSASRDVHVILSPVTAGSPHARADLI
jgi:hypothetical protein